MRFRPAILALLFALLAPASPARTQPIPARSLAPTEGTPVRLTLREVLRIGSVDGEHDAFGRAMDAAFGATGRIYVADDQNHRVSVFERTGRFVAHVGRQGNGPGELQSPWAVAVDARDTLFVWDMAQARVSVFGPGLTFRRSFSVPAEWTVNGIDFLADGALLLASYARGRGSLHVLERSGRPRATFGPVAPNVDLAGFESSLLGGSAAVDAGVVAFSMKSPYELWFFDGASRPRSRCRGEAGTTTQPSAVVVRTAQANELRWNRYVHSAQILALGGGRFLNVIHDPVRNRRTLDVVTPDCRRVARTRIDGPATLTRRAGNRLLAIHNGEVPQVVVYEYRIN